MPVMNRAAARNARGCDLSAKARVYGWRRVSKLLVEYSQQRHAMPIASPIMNTSVWSAIEDGFVRKKKPRVTWKRDMELMMVAPEMRPIAVAELLTMKRICVFVFSGEVVWLHDVSHGIDHVLLVASSPHDSRVDIFRRFCFSGFRQLSGVLPSLNLFNS